jgi:hypothetical protein
MIDAAGIKGHQQGAVGWLHIAQPHGRLLVEQPQQFQNAFMRRQPDFLSEIHE